MPSDPGRARELYHEAQDAGSPAAAYFLGHRFHVGDEELGIEADGARAMQLLRQASAQVCRHTYCVWSHCRGPTHKMSICLVVVYAGHTCCLSGVDSGILVVVFGEGGPTKAFSAINGFCT